MSSEAPLPSSLPTVAAPGNLAVSFQHISKTYSIRHVENRPTLVGEALMRRLRRPLARTPREDFHALTDVTADIDKGEAVGIIGRNGAGKSTLLKILSRVTEPTSGRIELYGRVGSLLEVGTGFHPELTGRENIFLNGSILGMKRAEITRAFDSIVEFAQVEQFLDTPVKRFSSGMYVRLAFAVAAHLNPEILVVDEVLAVGDAEFQRRCLGKMGEVSTQQGRTVLFVSHNMSAISFFCRRVIYLEQGCVCFDGETGEGIQCYLGTPGELEDSGVIDLTEKPRAVTVANPVFRRMEIRGDGPTPTARIRVGGSLSLTIDVEGLRIPQHFVAVGIVTETDIRVIGVNTLMSPMEVLDADADQVRVNLVIPSVPLVPGRYWIELRISEGGGIARKSAVDKIERAAMIEVEPDDSPDRRFQLYPQAGQAVCHVDASWEVESNGIIVAATATADGAGARTAGRTAVAGRRSDLR